MDMSTPGQENAVPVVSEETPLSTQDIAEMGFGPLFGLRQEIVDLQETLSDIQAIGGDAVSRKLDQMKTELDAFAPSVTFIGQIKSGKTTLVNAMAGRPGLLPADVNPWTSVVTSLHLGHPRTETMPSAQFRFFDTDEWDNLVDKGGRIGELSARTGADKEHEKLREQIAKMREKSKRRLGRKFELLLGQTHEYQSFDDALVKRYVCLGDDFLTGTDADQQGQFADITRSAELYLDAPSLPVAMTLRDTPGMNDTFMMREQITIRAIRDSKTCVVVLSAHQALSSVDMGLIRLISNVRSRQVVIYVNRIDELADPANQIPEIQSSLRETLARHNAPADVSVVFGSALWANAVITDTVGALPEASIQALENYGSSDLVPDLSNLPLNAAIWHLSGLPALSQALSDRIVESAGERLLENMRGRAANIVSGLRASYSIVQVKANGTALRKMSNEEIGALVRSIETRARANLNATLDKVSQSFGERIDQAHGRFISRALDALLEHLEAYGNNDVWSYSADGLRMLMRSAYQVMRSRYRKQVEAVYKQTADQLTEAYGKIFDVTASNFLVEAPEAPEVPPPVTLAQTIVLDVKSSWWKSWWARRRGYRDYAAGFRDLIESESKPMVDDLKHGQISEIRSLALAALDAFFEQQSDVLADVLVKSEISLDDLDTLFGVNTQEDREYLFSLIYDELNIDEDRIGEAA